MNETGSLKALDWPALLERLTAEAQSSGGRTLCAGLLPAADRPEAVRRMATVAELVTWLVAAAEKQIVLGADEVRPLGEIIAIAEGVRRAFLDSTRSPIPEIAALAAGLDPPRGLGRTIALTFDASGEISDAASPELARLREERKALTENARVAIERLMRAEEYASVLQDQFFTVRAERFVLPLKASAKSLGLGIVHDTSRTGETVFVEPTALVSANNRLKVVELDIRRESRRILEALTADVAAVAPALRACATTLAVLDATGAAARLGMAYGGSAISIVEEAVVDLRQARHPLLALAAATPKAARGVVANDVALGGAAPAILVVSGPNAGGKTVLMKTVGLAALMARGGLLVPAAPGSRIGCSAICRRFPAIWRMWVRS